MLYLQGKYEQLVKFLHPNDYTSPQHKGSYIYFYSFIHISVTHFLLCLLAVTSQMYLSIACLMSGSARDSSQYASTSMQLCETTNQEIDVGVVGNVYSIYGLSSLYQAHYDDAQHYLQLACRWNTSPLTHLQSITNMGSFYWLKLDGNNSCYNTLQEFILTKLKGNHENKSSGKTTTVTTNDVAAVTANTPVTGITMTNEVRANLTEAVSYWEEALNELTNPKKIPISACAPVGVDVLPNPTIKKEKNEENPLEIRLQDEKFAHAYAILLCNLADGYLLSGKEQLSVDTVSSALKTIEKYQNLPNFRGLYGYILGKLALIYMLNYQAVTAEGLLRTALDALASPACSNPIDKFERSKILLLYGYLLVKWEKRENLGQKYLEDSEKVRDLVPYKTGAHLCRMIQLQH